MICTYTPSIIKGNKFKKNDLTEVLKNKLRSYTYESETGDIVCDFVSCLLTEEEYIYLKEYFCLSIGF